MFRWCAFCQHLIGETPHPDDFQVTHDICNACSVGAAHHAPAPGVLRAMDLFSTLEQAGHSGNFQSCASAIDEAWPQVRDWFLDPQRFSGEWIAQVEEFSRELEATVRRQGS